MFAKRLKELRKERKMTQLSFAKEFNIASGTIAMWETGKREPDFETAGRIAEFFGVSVDYLLGKTDTKNAPTGEGGRELVMDDFDYALYNESKELSEEKKQMLLNMARFMRQEGEKGK